MSTWNHANPRGQSHQWRAGLAAWTVYGQRRTSDILCMYCSSEHSSCVIRDVFLCSASLSAACVGFNGSVEAPNQIPTVLLVFATVGADAPELCGDNQQHSVPDKVCAL